jgi:ferritin-like metal-binding protein YciE
MATRQSSKASTKGLEDLFLDGLEDIYYAEKKILKALPKMAKGAEAEEVSAAFEKHRMETEGKSGSVGAGVRSA